MQDVDSGSFRYFKADFCVHLKKKMLHKICEENYIQKLLY